MWTMTSNIHPALFTSRNEVSRWINSPGIDAAREAAHNYFEQTSDFNIKYIYPTQIINWILILPTMLFTLFALKTKATAKETPSQ